MWTAAGSASIATRAKTSASAKLLANVVPLDAVGIFGCAPTPLSAELHLLAVLQTQCTEPTLLPGWSNERLERPSPRSWSVRCTQLRSSLHRTIGHLAVSHSSAPAAIGINP